jgi:hypothetical protein
MSKATLFRLEWLKSRRQHILLIEMALLGFFLLYSIYDFSRMDVATGWIDMIYTLPILQAFAMPVILAALASRLCESEHKGGTFKLLETMQTPGSLFDAKWWFGAMHVVVLSMAEQAVWCAVGLACGFTGPVPTAKLALMLGTNCAVGLLVFTLQLGLSLLFANQMIPMTIGVAGSFLGLFSMFLPPVLERFLPTGYYGVLMIAGMDWNPQTEAIHFYWTEFDWPGLATLFVWLAALLILFRGRFARREA